MREREMDERSSFSELRTDRLKNLISASVQSANGVAPMPSPSEYLQRCNLCGNYFHRRQGELSIVFECSACKMRRIQAKHNRRSPSPLQVNLRPAIETSLNDRIDRLLQAADRQMARSPITAKGK